MIKRRCPSCGSTLKFHDLVEIVRCRVCRWSGHPEQTRLWRIVSIESVVALVLWIAS